MTHDISEALKLGTKVLVMDHGQIEQFATPENLLRHPATEFVKKLSKKNAVCVICQKNSYLPVILVAPTSKSKKHLYNFIRISHMMNSIHTKRCLLTNLSNLEYIMIEELTI